MSVLAAASALSGCALSTELEGEGTLGTEEQAVLPAVRQQKIDAKFAANQALLIAPNGGYTHFETGFAGARRDYQGAGFNSSIFFNDAFADAFIILGFIRSKFLQVGGSQTAMGLPTTDELPTAFNTGRYNNLNFGRILWKNGANEAFAIQGNGSNLNLDTYNSLGAEWGMLGFPTSDSAFVSNFWLKNTTEFGMLLWNNQTLFAWPVLTFNNSSNKLQTMSWPRMTSLTMNNDGAGGACVKARGAGFPAGKTVEFYSNDPGRTAKIAGTAVVASDGTFNFDQTPTGLCMTRPQIRKVSGVATIMAYVVSTRTRAVLAANTSAGINYTGAPL